MPADLLNVWAGIKKIAALKGAALGDKSVPLFPNTVVKDSVDASPSIPMGGSPSLKLKTNCSAELVVFVPPRFAGGADPDGILKARDAHPKRRRIIGRTQSNSGGALLALCAPPGLL